MIRIRIHQLEIKPKYLIVECIFPQQMLTYLPVLSSNFTCGLSHLMEPKMWAYFGLNCVLDGSTSIAALGLDLLGENIKLE